MPQSTDLISSIQDQLIDIIEVYANYFVKLSAKNHSPKNITCLLYTSPSPRDLSTSRMPSSA